jgi:hypothetical protein
MVDPTELLRMQHGVLTRRQALSYLSQTALDFRLGRRWKVILPGVYVAQTGPLGPRQRLQAALLFAGHGAMLDDSTALAEYQMTYLPEDPLVHVLVPADNQRHGKDFVAIRRTVHLPAARRTNDGLTLAPAARALTNFALRHPDDRAVRAVLASAVQRRRVTLEQLHHQYEICSSRGKRRLTRVLEELGAGVRSAPEGDVRALVLTSKVLPTPLYNCLLELPDGRRISPDLLIKEAALVHETNGRKPHYEDEDDFDSMQARHDAMTVAGLTVLHNSPRLIAREGPRVLTDLEHCYLRDKGKGLPPGVRIIRYEQCDIALSRLGATSHHP